MRFGKIDFTYGLDLGSRTADNDGPIYMVNFMKYRTVAGYDGVKNAEAATQPEISGIEADDLYNPTEVLTRIGAQVVFHGDVVAQGTPGEWDRMGIVKYASRVSFIEMQERPDFKEKYVHKEAGMLYTIVTGTLPHAAHVPIDRAMFCTFELTAVAQRTSPSNIQACLDVEGTIVGDGRVWSALTMKWSDEIPVVAPREAGTDTITVVAKIAIDRMGKALVESNS